jgi:hypothetical protein
MGRHTFAVAWACVATLAACGSSGNGATPGAKDAGSTGDASDASSAGTNDGGVDATDAARAAVCSDAGAPSQGDFAGQGNCPMATCTLTGTLDGKAVQQTYPRGNQWDFINGGSFDADFGTGGHVHLDFQGTILDMQVANANAQVTMPSEGPRAGQILCGGGGTRIQSIETPSEVRFILRCMNTPCFGGGTPIEGQLYGCCAP